MKSTPFLLATALVTGACASRAPDRSEHPPLETRTPRVEETHPVRVVEHPPPAQPVPGQSPLLVPERPLPGAIWPPPGYEPSPCELELPTIIGRRGDGYEVVALAHNRTDKPITLELPDRCPQGPVVFVGLSPEYDYYGTCAAGACAGPRDPVRFNLDPGQRIELAAIMVRPGGGGCTQALPPGRHHIGFSVPYRGQTCSRGPAAIEVRDPKPPPRPPTKTAPAPGVTCPPMPACGIACPGGSFARDAQGCPLCGCAERRGVMPH
jgi:hypothetical protein